MVEVAGSVCTVQGCTVCEGGPFSGPVMIEASPSYRDALEILKALIAADNYGAEAVEDLVPLAAAMAFDLCEAVVIERLARAGEES